MTDRRPRRQSRAALISTAVAAACIFVSRLLADPDDSLGGPLLHLIVLAASGILLATSIVLLALRGRTPGDKR